MNSDERIRTSGEKRKSKPNSTEVEWPIFCLMVCMRSQRESADASGVMIHGALIIHPSARSAGYPGRKIENHFPLRIYIMSPGVVKNSDRLGAAAHNFPEAMI